MPDVKRNKLDHKSQIGIFLGYSSCSKGYRIYNLQTKSIQVNRDVKFDELSQWNWEQNQADNPSREMLENENKQEAESDSEEENQDEDPDFAVRGTRTLDDIYARCNLATLEQSNYAEDENWRVAM